MAYIGKTPVIGNFVKLDSITVVNGQAAYTMQNGGANFTSYDNVNQFLVSLNGVLQAPTDSFTVSGSTLTFASNLSTGDVIDFVLVLGNSLDIGTPSDNTVTAAKLNNDIISGSTELASEPADTDEFLVSDAGTIKRIDYSLIKGGGITEMDMYRLTADVTSDSDITSNLERVDTFNFSKIGTGMTESSGVFTFPSTGLYEVTVQARVSNAGAGSVDRIQINTKISTDGGSNYSTIDGCDNAVDGSGGGASATFQQTNFINVTTSNFRIKFTAASLSSGSALTGNTTHNRTCFIFKRLGDSQ